MTDKELRRLSRTDLLEMLLEQSKEVERLQQELAEARQQLEERRIMTEEAGSIAEAALRINRVFEAAQAAADQYLENIRQQAPGHTDTKPTDSQENEKRDEEYLELALAYFLNVGNVEKSRICLNELTNKELAENLKMLIGAYEKQECPEDVRKYKKSLAYLEKVWKKRSKISEEKQKQEIQCLIRGYGLLDDEDSVEKVLELVKRGMQTDYLNDPVKKEMLEYQAAACEKKKTEEEAAKIYTELLEMEQEDGNREMLYKKIAQLYEAAGRCDMAMDICIQGIGELKESKELKLMHIRFMCADPSVSREECSMKIKEYVRDDGQLPDQEEFKKLQKEYAIKMEGEEVWVGR